MDLAHMGLSIGWNIAPCSCRFVARRCLAVHPWRCRGRHRACAVSMKPVKFPEIPCSRRKIPCSVEKIPCSGKKIPCSREKNPCSAKNREFADNALELLRNWRCKHLKWAGKIPCYFLSQGIEHQADPPSTAIPLGMIRMMEAPDPRLASRTKRAGRA